MLLFKNRLYVWVTQKYSKGHYKRQLCASDENCGLGLKEYYLFFTSMSCVSFKSTWLCRFKVMLGSVCSVQKCPVPVSVYPAEPSLTNTSCCTLVPCISTLPAAAFQLCRRYSLRLFLKVFVSIKNQMYQTAPTTPLPLFQHLPSKAPPQMSQCCTHPSGDRK